MAPRHPMVQDRSGSRLLSGATCAVAVRQCATLGDGSTVDNAFVLSLHSLHQNSIRVRARLRIGFKIRIRIRITIRIRIRITITITITITTTIRITIRNTIGIIIRITIRKRAVDDSRIHWNALEVVGEEERTLGGVGKIG